MRRSIEFNQIIARKPALSVNSGLRADDTGQDPDPVPFDAQHQQYLDVIAEQGADTIVLPALEAYPDSVFVEDAAICIRGAAIVTNPGADYRACRFSITDKNSPAIIASLLPSITT